MANKAISPSVRTAVRIRGDHWALAYSPGPVYGSLRGLSAITMADFRDYVSARLFMLGKAAGMPIGARVSYYGMGDW